MQTNPMRASTKAGGIWSCWVNSRWVSVGRVNFMLFVSFAPRVATQCERGRIRARLLLDKQIGPWYTLVGGTSFDRVW